MIIIKTLLIALLFAATTKTIHAQRFRNQIHSHLRNCYRGVEADPFVGQSFQLLLDLIRKAEDANPTAMDIRRLSVNIMHRLRVDGIERTPSLQETEAVIPFSITGRMGPKYDILLQLISDTPGALNFTHFMGQEDICFLHKMISSSVEPFHRGDETITCPLTLMTGQNDHDMSWNQNNGGISSPILTSPRNRNVVSRCPIELGVIRTHNYGTISPGTFIVSVAAGLQPQTVQIGEFLAAEAEDYDNIESMQLREAPSERKAKLLSSADSVNNQYAAGLAGDLAEVCVFQGPVRGVNLSVGLSGAWNDTNYPRIHLFPTTHQELWDMTDAEILAGIDGLFISQQIQSWVGRISRLRLSQLLEMYYSPRGIPIMAMEDVSPKKFYTGRKRRPMNNRQEEVERPLDFERMVVGDGSFNPIEGLRRACDRAAILDLIDVAVLKDETYHFSLLLQEETPTVIVPDEILRRNCDAAVDRFFDQAKNIINMLPTCEQLNKEMKKVAVDLTLIIDGSRRRYDNLQLINHIGESIDVSTYGSHISVIHGTTGEYLVNRTNSIATAFVQLRNFTGPFPTTLSLSRSLNQFAITLAEQTEQERRSRIVAATSKVVVIISQSTRITSADFNSARRIMESTLLQFPDLYFVFITNDQGTFVDLITGLSNLGTLLVDNRLTNIRRTENYGIITTPAINPQEFTTDLVDVLRKVPRRIVAPFCQQQHRTGDSLSFFPDEFEAYLTPEVELNFRVNPILFLDTNELKFKFHGFGYGTFTVCMSRQSTHLVNIQCTTVSDHGSAEFIINNPCGGTNDCPGIYFSVNLDESLLWCSENDCRYPDQIRFILRHEGLRCQVDGARGGGSERPLISASYFGLIVLILLNSVYVN